MSVEEEHLRPETGTIPRDAKEALDLWDDGEPIGAFEVEAQRCTQQEIYAVAFEMIRAGRAFDGKAGREVYVPAGVTISSTTEAKISKRERDVAHSIAHVALLKGWAVMVAQHLAGGHIKAIIVKKS